MNYGALYTTGLFRGSYVNDPEEKFWHSLLKEMIFTIRVRFMCEWAAINEHECKHTQL